jgi:hypothetical protein
VVVETCCVGIRGNIDGDPNDLINVADLTYMVNFKWKGGPWPPCLDEADVDGDGRTALITDVTYLVDYLFRSGPPPPPCP